MWMVQRGRWAWLLLALILLGYGLRTHALERNSFWQDEGLTPLRSGYPLAEILSNRITIQEAVTKDTHPPLYYLLLHVTRQLWGESDFSYRYFSVLAGTLLIPLLFQLGRRMQGEALGLLAALLIALNPLQIWYAQEARMYTLVVLLAGLGTYAQWRALQASRAPSAGLHAGIRRWFLLYLLAMGLAFYTHYVAALLIAGQSFFWLWLLWRAGQRRLIIAGAVAGLLLALPLIPFTLPRLFTGAESNYFYVPPWIMLQDVVHGFILGLTTSFARWGVKLLDAGMALLLLLGLAAPSLKGGRLVPLYLLAYLLAAVAGLALLSLLKPSYQGVRHTMIGSPAIVLLAGRGALAVAGRPRLRPALPAVAALLLAGPLLSLNNFYRHPLYAKDDGRALIRHVEQMAGSHDVLLFNDAVSLPLYWHYARRNDLPATALPVYPYASGPDTAGQLAELAAGTGRIWLVLGLPADGRDDQEQVRSWLQDSLLPVDDFSAHGRNTIVRVQGYSTRPPAQDRLPQGATALDLRWAEMPALSGLELDFDQPATLPTLWFTLYWQGEAPPAGQQLRFRLQDPEGNAWLEQSLPLWPEGVPWPAGHLAARSYPLTLPPGTPPGPYQLRLQPWQEGSTAPGGDWQTLSSLSLGPESAWPLPPEWPFSQRCPLRFAGGFVLRGVATPGIVRPGHPLPLTLYWQGSGEAAQLRYQVEAVGSDGSVLHRTSGPLAPAWIAGNWPTGQTVRSESGIFAPPQAVAGNYRLRWRLLDGDSSLEGHTCWPPWSQAAPFFGHIRVQDWPLNTRLPALAQPIRASFGDAIQLYGAEMGTQATPGQALDITLYWLALSRPEAGYKVFLHLVSATDGAILAQVDGVPANWLRPTDGWRPGEVITDPYRLLVPADLPPGDYRLYLGLYRPEDNQRLPLSLGGQGQPEDQLLLSTFRLGGGGP